MRNPLFLRWFLSCCLAQNMPRLFKALLPSICELTKSFFPQSRRIDNNNIDRSIMGKITNAVCNMS